MYNAPYQGVANNLAQYGRFGDSQLVHMNPIEVQMLSPVSDRAVNPEPADWSAGGVPALPRPLAGVFPRVVPLDWSRRWSSWRGRT
jgi:hypothetical protein